MNNLKSGYEIIQAKAEKWLQRLTELEFYTNIK